MSVQITSMNLQVDVPVNSLNAIESRGLNVYYGNFLAVKHVRFANRKTKNHSNYWPFWLRKKHDAASI